MSKLYFMYLAGPYPLDVGMCALSFPYLAWATVLGYDNV